MVSRGYAWNYDQYCGARYQSIENQARSARRGLWAGSNPIEPWNWRRGQQN